MDSVEDRSLGVLFLPLFDSEASFFDGEALGHLGFYQRAEAKSNEHGNEDTSHLHLLLQSTLSDRSRRTHRIPSGACEWWQETNARDLQSGYSGALFVPDDKFVKQGSAIYFYEAPGVIFGPHINGTE